MIRGSALALVVSVAGLAASAMAQPTLNSLGTGTPGGVSNATGGTIFISGSGFGGVNGAARWALTGSTLTGANLGGDSGGIGIISTDGAFQVGTWPNTGPSVRGNTATGVSPAFSTTPTLVASTTLPADTESAFRYYKAGTNSWVNPGGYPIVGSLAVFGSGSNGQSTGTFISPNALSKNGRFVGTQGYISSWTAAAGTAIGANQFVWRPAIWDSQANGGAGQYTILPTPFRTSSNTWRRRTGNVYQISNDGTVVLGATEHNVATGAAPDPDGGRLVVWRLNSGTGNYDMTYLPNGNSGGNFYTISTTPGGQLMNAAGTLIVGTGIANDGLSTYIAKWTWDAGTSTWTGPTQLFTQNLSTPASWLPLAVTSCGVPPSLFLSGMSDDGSIIVGQARYSTCGSFMSGGFIWRQSDNLVQDWYDFNVAQGTPGVTANYGPIGDNGDPNKGLPKLGFPSGISADGSTIVGFQGGNQLIVGAVPWVFQFTGGPTCVPASVVINPAATSTFNKCTASIILNARGAGTLPITYQWNKAGVPLSDGASAGGGTIVGATTSQLRINNPGSADAGTYTCTITGCDNNPITTTASVVSLSNTAASNVFCNQATSLTGTLPITQTVDACSNYTGVDGESACAVTWSQLWYSFTPATTGSYRVSLCSTPTTTFSSMISIYDACGGNQLACNTGQSVSSICSSSSSAVVDRVTLQGGTTYLIRTAAKGTSAPSASFGIGTLTISAAPAAVANDNCANAINATLGITNAVDSTNATTDGTSGCTNTNGVSGRDVWLKFVPATTGDYRLSTCGGATGTTSATFDTVLSLFDGCGGNEIACNDNQPSGMNSLCTGTTSSRIERIQLQAGTTYYIRVAGAAPAAGAAFPGGTANVTIAVAPTLPANDECANARVISQGSFAFDLTEATTSSGTNAVACTDANSTATASNSDVYYSFTAPCAATYVFQTCGSAISNPMLHIYTGCGGTQIACNDNVGSGVSGCTSNQARASATLTAGQSVIVRLAVSGTSRPNPGTGTLQVSATPALCVADVDCNTQIEVADIFGFLSAYFSNCTGQSGAPCNGKTADVDGNGLVEVADIFAFLSRWFGGC